MNWAQIGSRAAIRRRRRAGAGPAGALRILREWNSAERVSAIFSKPFLAAGKPASGDFEGARARKNRNSCAKAWMSEADLLVTLEEAVRGATRQITVRRPGVNGRSERTDSYQVRIPAGVREGQRIRLAGQGDPGKASGRRPAGDLYLRVRLARHPDFRVEGSDLYCDLDLAPWEAVLGVQATISTLDGSTTVKVPAGAAAESQLRLRGLGLPKAEGGRGDLYATVRIQTSDVGVRRRNAHSGSSWPKPPPSIPAIRRRRPRP